METALVPVGSWVFLGDLAKDEPGQDLTGWVLLVADVREVNNQMLSDSKSE